VAAASVGASSVHAHHKIREQQDRTEHAKRAAHAASPAPRHVLATPQF